MKRVDYAHSILMKEDFNTGVGVLKKGEQYCLGHNNDIIYVVTGKGHLFFLTRIPDHLYEAVLQ